MFRKEIACQENYGLAPAVNEISVPPSLPSVVPMHWQGLGVVYLRFESCSVPEHQHRSIQVSIPFSASSFEARWRTAAGEFRSKRLGTGDTCVIPAEQPHTIWWEREMELVNFELDPTFVASAAHESLTGDRVEIVEHYGAKDPMIGNWVTRSGESFTTGFRSDASTLNLSPTSWRRISSGTTRRRDARQRGAFIWAV